MFDSIGNHPKGKRCRPIAGFLFAGAIGDDTRQLRDFADPPAVGFAFKLNS